MGVDAAKVKSAAAALEALSHLPLDERVLVFVGQLKGQGLADAFAKRVYYRADSQNASAVAPQYSLQLVTADGVLLVTGIEHPGPGSADCLLTKLRCNSTEYNDSDVLADPFFEDETNKNDDGTALPWPIVIGALDTLRLEFTGAALNVNGLQVRGWHVDDFTAAVFREVGEIWCRGVNETMVAAAVMTTSAAANFRFDQEQELTHLTSKETLGAGVARTNVMLQIKKDKLTPGADTRSFVLPPISLKKPGARLSVALRASDSFEFQARYTGGGNAAEVQLVLLGRRRYRECA